jgi:phosphohistidine phosphatase
MLAAALAAEMRVKAVLASPFLRARETASILAGAVGAPLEDREMLGAGQSTGAGLLRLGREAGEGAALVGHNPEVAEAIALAAGASRTVPPGTVAAVEADDVGYRLLWLHSP